MPYDSQPTKDRILASAERLFADRGYDGVSLREIAARADAQLALIHYHFGSKLDVYRAIWAARYTTEVARQREESFGKVDYSAPTPAIVRQLVEVFLLPLLRMTENERLRDFVALGARECTDPREAERGVLAEFLDAAARKFLDSFSRALPKLSAADVAWGYQAMVGVSVLHIADRDRITRISSGKAKAGDSRSAMPALVEFCVGGWLALAAARQHPAPRSRPAVKTRRGSRSIPTRRKGRI
jgi:AcrR family transcriptional regulator